MRTRFGSGSSPRTEKKDIATPALGFFAVSFSKFQPQKKDIATPAPTRLVAMGATTVDEFCEDLVFAVLRGGDEHADPALGLPALKQKTIPEKKEELEQIWSEERVLTWEEIFGR